MPSLFTSQTPTSADNTEPGGITTATSLVFAEPGLITGVRFFATTTVGGTYTAMVWEITGPDDPPPGTGTLLASKVHGGAVTPGAWNTITLDTPVPVIANTELYRVGVHNSQGRYVSTPNFPGFTTGSGGLVNGDITGPDDGSNPVGLGSVAQGSFTVSAPPALPFTSFQDSSYFVDVIYEPTPPAEGEADFPLALTLAAVGETPSAGRGAAAFTLSLTAASTGAAEPPASVRCGWEGIDPGALGLCDDWEARPVAARNAALTLATDYLWAATGRQYGICPVTVNPQQGRLRPVQYQAYPVWPGSTDGGAYGGGPFLFAGRWFNAGDGIACCGHRGCAVVLRGPVADVREVVIEGETVEESAYRVEISGGVYLLVRTDGTCWPACNDGSFTITYGYGRALPGSLVTAVALLACEWVKALVGGDCKLPARMTRLSRQGIDIEVEAPDGANGSTGVRQVDDVIAMLNPGKRQSPPLLLSPDLPEARDRFTIWEA
jgi:hypothetical protein